MEDIMKMIGKAEEDAERIKEEATSKAREITAAAEAEAASLIKSAEAKAKNLREHGVRVAQEQAEAEYAKAIKKEQTTAVAYADEVLTKSDAVVKEIVRRVCGGN